MCYARRGGPCSLHVPLSVPTVVIDAYSPKPYVDPTQPVPLNTSVILVCRVVGVPSGGQLQYEWTCPGEECNIGDGRHPNRKTLGDTVVVNVISFDDAGSYVCSVTEEEGAMVFAVGSAEINLIVEGERSFFEVAACLLVDSLYVVTRVEGKYIGLSHR